MDEDAFVRHVGGRLAELPGVEAVTLGGSRAEGTSRPDSDWDFSLYYRGRFEPQALRDAGWPGEVSEIGGWGGGVSNGGAWLEIDGRRSDVHYRDLDVIDREIAAAHEGRFTIQPLRFHLAGLPSYLVLAELAVKRVRAGLPRCGRAADPVRRASGTGRCRCRWRRWIASCALPSTCCWPISVARYRPGSVGETGRARLGPRGDGLGQVRPGQQLLLLTGLG